MTNSSDRNADEAAFLSSESDQCWAHYRHIETQRSQYLGFFFTVSLGSAALAIPSVSTVGISSDAGLSACAAFLATYFALTTFVWISIRRNGRVLSHYDRCLRELRTAREDLLRLPSGLRGILTVQLPKAPGLRHVGLQTSAERIVAGFACTELVLQLLLLSYAIIRSQSIFICVAIGLVATGSLSALVSMIGPQRTPNKH